MPLIVKRSVGGAIRRRILRLRIRIRKRNLAAALQQAAPCLGAIEAASALRRCRPDEFIAVLDAVAAPLRRERAVMQAITHHCPSDRVREATRLVLRGVTAEAEVRDMARGLRPPGGGQSWNTNVAGVALSLWDQLVARHVTTEDEARDRFEWLRKREALEVRIEPGKQPAGIALWKAVPETVRTPALADFVFELPGSRSAGLLATLQGSAQDQGPCPAGAVPRVFWEARIRRRLRHLDQILVDAYVRKRSVPR